MSDNASNDLAGGWLARDGDGSLFWFELEPEWNDEAEVWGYPDSVHFKHLPNDEYPNLKPGECAHVMHAHELGRAGAAFEAEAHRKTLSENARLKADVEELVEGLEEIADLLDEKKSYFPFYATDSRKKARALIEKHRK